MGWPVKGLVGTMVLPCAAQSVDDELCRWGYGEGRRGTVVVRLVRAVMVVRCQERPSPPPQKASQ